MIKLPPSTPAQQFGAEATRQIRRLVVKITKVDDSLDLASSEGFVLVFWEDIPVLAVA